MPQLNKQKILNGRKAVDAYRQAHTQLHSKPWHKGIPEEHTPLLEQMLKELREAGFNSLYEFFDASEELNVKELGFTDRQDFDKRATDKDREALGGKWH